MHESMMATDDEYRDKYEQHLDSYKDRHRAENMMAVKRAWQKAHALKAQHAANEHRRQQTDLREDYEEQMNVIADQEKQTQSKVNEVLAKVEELTRNEIDYNQKIKDLQANDERMRKRMIELEQNEIDMKIEFEAKLAGMKSEATVLEIRNNEKAALLAQEKENSEIAHEQLERIINQKNELLAKVEAQYESERRDEHDEKVRHIAKLEARHKEDIETYMNERAEHIEHLGDRLKHYGERIKLLQNEVDELRDTNDVIEREKRELQLMADYDRKDYELRLNHVKNENKDLFALAKKNLEKKNKVESKVELLEAELTHTQGVLAAADRDTPDEVLFRKVLKKEEQFLARESELRAFFQKRMDDKEKFFQDELEKQSKERDTLRSKLYALEQRNEDCRVDKHELQIVASEQELTIAANLGNYAPDRMKYFQVLNDRKPEFADEKTENELKTKDYKFASEGTGNNLEDAARNTSDQHRRQFSSKSYGSRDVLRKELSEQKDLAKSMSSFLATLQQENSTLKKNLEVIQEGADIKQLLRDKKKL